MVQSKEICYECGHSVALGSGRYVNRIPSLDDYQTRVDMGVPFPEGEYVCEACDEIRLEELNIGEVYAIY